MLAHNAMHTILNTDHHRKDALLINIKEQPQVWCDNNPVISGSVIIKTVLTMEQPTSPFSFCIPLLTFVISWTLGVIMLHTGNIYNSFVV